MENNFYVYEHWRPDRDECFYIGKGKGRRAYNMNWRNRYHKAIQAKLIRNGYGIEIKIVSSGMTEDDAFSLEKERIKFWEEYGADLANMTSGGEGTSNPTAETRTKISWSKIGNKNMVGRKLSQETKDKISKSHMGKAVNLELIARLAEINRNREHPRGYKLPESTRAKMSAAHAGNQYAKGTVWTAEMRACAAARRKGKKQPPDAIEKTRQASMKPVMCLEDGRAFRSAVEAGHYYGLFNHAKVAEVCRGVRKTAAGRTFEYIEA